MNIGQLIAATVVLIGLYGLHRLALQRAYAQGLADGTHHGYAAGSGDAARRYAQGHEDGLAEGREQTGRVDLIKYNKAYNEGYERGQVELLEALQQTGQMRDGQSPAMSA